jgi:hypothetical protein
VFGCAVGYLEYKAGTILHRRNFAVRVQLDGGGIGGAVTESAEYDIELEAGKSGYKYELPIHNYMLSNCVDMFRVNLSSDRSATFRFDVTVMFSDGSSLPLGTIDLRYFRPNGAIDTVATTAVTQTAPPTNTRCQ